MKDGNMIFLISQPRSGSTLTQRILGSHSDVYTTSEPWLMLPLCYTLKPEGTIAVYDHRLQFRAMHGFLKDMPVDGYSQYCAALRNLYQSLCDNYLKESGKVRFLDKTPRYYLIIDELLEIFPRAKFIILARHPLSVLGSITQRWVGCDWYRLSRYAPDLYEAPGRLRHAKEKHPGRLHFLTYESLLEDLEIAVRGICQYTGLEFENDMLNLHESRGSPWMYGDQNNAFKKGTVSGKHASDWQACLHERQYWRVMHDYLHYLGRPYFEAFGYDFDRTRTELESAYDDEDKERIMEETYSLASLLDTQSSYMAENQRVNAIVAERQKRIEERNEEVEQLRSQLATRDAKLEEAQKRINDFEKRLSETNYQRASLEKELTRPDEERQKTEARLLALENSLHELEETSGIINPIKKIKSYRKLIRLSRTS